MINGDNGGAGTAGLGAKAGTSTSPLLRVNGPCLTGTLARIDNLSDAALEKVRRQAEELVDEVLTTYATEIAVGEVGSEGTALTSETTATEGMGPTGLLYGRIQSGKTVAMITFAALAIDNGFRIIVVLTTNFLKLVEQTRERFAALDRVVVRASSERDGTEAEIDHLRKTIPKFGLLVICPKHPKHLKSVQRLLTKVGAENYPALILDDEADQASLDNNERKRGRAASPEEVEPTAVHAGIKAMREHLRHHLFLQITATPFALLLQRVDSPLRPRFTFLLEPGDGYTGGEAFFSTSRITEAGSSGAPPLCYIPEDEGPAIADGSETEPKGLHDAIAFFLVAAATQVITDPKTLRKSQNFLCHTSHKRSEHEKLSELIVTFVSRLLDEMEPLRGEAEILLRCAYDELNRTVENLPSFQRVVDEILSRLPLRKIRLVNSDGNAGEEVPGAPNFIVGGNIVGRGLTIPNLLVTYYLRQPKVSQMDTMLQHARMFGYRSNLMRYTRVFLPRTLAIRFWHLHQAEIDLRDLLRDHPSLEQVPVMVAGELKPTRYGVLDTGSVTLIKAGKHQYSIAPNLGLTEKQHSRVEELARAVWPDWDAGSNETPALAPLEVVNEWLGILAPDWDLPAIKLVLTSMANGANEIYAAYRPIDAGARKRSGKQYLNSGALSGDELSAAHARPRPTFFLFKQIRQRPWFEDRTFFYPTLVFPKKMPHYIYNDGEFES